MLPGLPRRNRHFMRGRPGRRLLFRRIGVQVDGRATWRISLQQILQVQRRQCVSRLVTQRLTVGRLSTGGIAPKMELQANHGMCLGKRR